MRTRTLAGLLALCLLTMLAAGCAKQQVKKEGPTSTTTVEGALPPATSGAASGQRELPVTPPAVPDQQSLTGGDASGGAGGAGQQLAEQALLPVLFDFDSFTLSGEAREILAKNAAWLKKNPTARVQVEGHCDERGSDEYNLALGEKRANAAATYLKSLGINAERLAIISYGKERPADPGHDEAAWAKNRRAAFVALR